MSIRFLSQRGITLIEQIVFIVIVSVGVIALVSSMSPMIRASADPMVTKQFVAIAESLLNEILHQPFSMVATRTIPRHRRRKPTVLAPAMRRTPWGQLRRARRATVRRVVFFDNVRDYAGFAMDDVTDPAGGTSSAAIVLKSRWPRPGARSGWPPTQPC